ncbi:MAG: hypothetical protein G8345_14415 [Magnetococcales bacterium]|nr:hypothetical protein [Magnetococcales bacterium]NGZ28069.1 hypothetical protein [Magnetococcales bacterium]
MVIAYLIKTVTGGLSDLRSLKRAHPDLPMMTISGGYRSFHATDLMNVARIEHADALM